MYGIVTSVREAQSQDCVSPWYGLAIDTFYSTKYIPRVEDFWRQVRGRLAAEERSLSWLAKRIGVTRSAMGNYVNGYRKTPDRVRTAVALVLDIREKQAAA